MSFCEYEENTRCNITRLCVCVCVLPILDTQDSHRTRAMAGFRFQQHPLETTLGLDAFLHLTPSVTSSFIPVFTLYLFFFFTFICRLHPSLSTPLSLLLLFLLWQRLCLTPFFFIYLFYFCTTY